MKKNAKIFHKVVDIKYILIYNIIILKKRR
nr:MAG TPA: hypothetical protein [Caudoviricetes sp.]